MGAAMSTTEVTEGAGTYSGTESGVEANGIGCATPPSVSSGTTGPAPARVRIVQTQIQLISGAVLMPAHFDYGEYDPDELNSNTILLNPDHIGNDLITGDWRADTSSSSTGIVVAGGTFTLRRGTPQPTPTPIPPSPTATPQPTGGPILNCDQFPPPCPDVPPGVLPKNPLIASGSLCRGACGPDCPSSCAPLNDQHLCVQDSHGCNYLCVYHVISCGSHAGCRTHDDCYDACAESENETELCTSAGICHCRCDLGCRSNYGIVNCTSWMLGHGPFDSVLNFSEQPRQTGPFDSCPSCPFGACPQ